MVFMLPPPMVFMVLPPPMVFVVLPPPTKSEPGREARTGVAVVARGILATAN